MSYPSTFQKQLIIHIQTDQHTKQYNLITTFSFILGISNQNASNCNYNTVIQRSSGSCIVKYDIMFWREVQLTEQVQTPQMCHHLHNTSTHLHPHLYSLSVIVYTPIQMNKNIWRLARVVFTCFDFFCHNSEWILTHL